MKYRIEIRELNNGNVQYIPQVDENSNYVPLPGIYQPKWMNLIYSSSYISSETIALDDIREAHFETEEDAISFIEEHKKQYAIESAFRVKNVTYKEL